MKSHRVWYVLSLLFLMTAGALFVGCQAIEDTFPATRGDVSAIEAANQDAIDGQMAVVDGLEEGNTVKVIGGALFSIMSALSASIGLSRRRRSQQILAEKAKKLSDAASAP